MLVDSTILCWCCFFILIILVFGNLTKIYLKLRIKKMDVYTCLVGKVAIVTGANSGIGYATALELAKRGAKVILACRNVMRAQKAVKSIIFETGNCNISYKILDLASFKSVRSFAKEINDTEEKIDVLINNAGTGGIDDQKTEDGNLVMIQVNYLSHFLLTHLLLDNLKKSSECRIINLSSSLANRSALSLQNLKHLNEYSYFVHDYFARSAMYANAKLCTIYFTQELAERLKIHGLTVNAVHPGSILTGIWDVPVIFAPMLKLIGHYYFKTEEEGARTIIYLATSQRVGSLTGKLFENCTEIDVYKTARSITLRQELWYKSEKIVGLTKRDKIPRTFD